MPVNTNKNGQCRSQYLFDPQTTRYLGTVQIHYTQTTYNAAVKRYVRYIKERFKWWALGLSAILLILPLWLNPSHDLKFTGVSRLVLIFTLVCLWSMFLLISRRINDFKSKTKQVTFTKPVRYEFYLEGIVFMNLISRAYFAGGIFMVLTTKKIICGFFCTYRRVFPEKRRKSFAIFSFPPAR